MAIIPPPPPCAGRGAPTRAGSTAEWLATIQSDARAHPDASRPPWEACPEGVAGGARGPRGRGRGGCVLLAIGSGEGGDGKPISRGERRAAHRGRGAGAVHGLGQRRPADPLAVWERALALGGGDYDFAPVLKELRPYVAGADLGICHVETPMTPAPPTSYPIFNTPPALAKGVEATGWDVCDTASNHSLDQGQTGSTPPARRSTTPGSRTRARSRRRPRSARLVIDGRPRGEGRLPRLHDGHQRDPAPHPWSVNIASPARDPRRRAQARRRTGAEAVIVNLHWGGEIVPEYQPQPSPGQLDAGQEAHRFAADHRDRRPGPARRAADRAHQRQVRRLQRGQPDLQPEPGGWAAGVEPGRDGRPASLRRHGWSRARARSAGYVPVFVNHPDYEVLPIGDALKRGQGDPELLRDSYQRTVGVVGSGKQHRSRCRRSCRRG